jgi:hypothetical protein
MNLRNLCTLSALTLSVAAPLSLTACGDGEHERPEERDGRNGHGFTAFDRRPPFR